MRKDNCNSRTNQSVTLIVVVKTEEVSRLDHLTRPVSHRLHWFTWPK
jgi:hypothetical protein